MLKDVLYSNARNNACFDKFGLGLKEAYCIPWSTYVKITTIREHIESIFGDGREQLVQNLHIC